MNNKVGKTAGKTMRTIRKHRLSTPEKYEAFRREHPELNLLSRHHRPEEICSSSVGLVKQGTANTSGCR